MPDKRREGSVSISGDGCNTTEISCEQANGEFPARKDKHVVDGSFVVSNSNVGPKVVDEPRDILILQPISAPSNPFAVVNTLNLQVSSMSDLTREQLRAALRATGEEPPASWTKSELRLRLQEITGADLGQTIKKLNQGPPSEYQTWLRQLNQAKVRKALLQKFVSEKLKLTNVDNMTIPQLELAGLRKIYEISKPHPTDPMGFGKYSYKSYEQVMAENLGYCEWAKKTVSEGPDRCDPKLARFTRWLEMVNQEELVPEKNLFAKFKGPTKSNKKEASSSQASASSSQPSSIEAKMETMINMMTELQGEVEKIKEDQKPRKKGPSAREVESDASSFQWSRRPTRSEEWQL